MKKYLIKWIEHHRKTIEADTAEEAMNIFLENERDRSDDTEILREKYEAEEIEGN